MSFAGTVRQGVSCFVFQSNEGISSRLDCVNLRMSKCAYESRPSKRKKPTAKADALRAATEKTKALIQSFSVPEGSGDSTA